METSAGVGSAEDYVVLWQRLLLLVDSTDLCSRLPNDYCFWSIPHIFALVSLTIIALVDSTNHCHGLKNTLNCRICLGNVYSGKDHSIGRHQTLRQELGLGTERRADGRYGVACAPTLNSSQYLEPATQPLARRRRDMATATAAAAAAVEMTEIEGRGRAMVALRPLKGGEIVLKDSPIVLYSAFPFLSDDHQNNNVYCSHCFITVSHQSQNAFCSTCGSRFCSIHCQSVASATSHTPWVCQALTRFRQYVSDHSVELDLQLQARFLVSAYNLAFVSPARFQTLLSLQGSVSSQPDSDSSAVFLHSFISSLSPTPPHELGFSLELTCVLLAKDKLNAFGLMEPFSEEREERSVRAYGIYPMASFFNHDCLPNACRFDYIDVIGSASSNTVITIRMIHDVPQGREICLSYFPVNLKYSERQKRLRDDYGFVCDCDRCKVEANWSDNDDLDVDENNDGEEEDEETSGVMDEDHDEEMEDEDGDVMKGEDDFPHAYFFLTYMCDRKNCWGTLAPVAPSVATTSGVMECNVCGNCKNLDQV
ncbi:hypothetical protein L6452_17111 [Arctium lappa]|uniref:Uncharacterized protein n=1 Tax=Arctium lappa TaxID=4217 RepID=A0ACB9C2G0_ARCLA|nr:hypothetical protein L6452_17111 [Arctium lappa]